MNHLDRYPEIAFSAADNTSAAVIERVAKEEACTAIYIVGAAPELVDTLRRSGLPVVAVPSIEDLPDQAFKWFWHKGFWATVKTVDGTLGDLMYAEDSLTATRALLNRYTQSVRESFNVQPVAVSVLDVSFHKPAVTTTKAVHGSMQ